MISNAADYLFLILAATPFIYYLLVLYSSWRFFWRSEGQLSANSDFTPPVSNLKPVRGLDPEAYENFASYCRQDYPDYELIFCVSDENDGSVPVLEKLMRDFPERRIRVLYGSGRNAINDKVAKLVRMVNEAQNEVIVINDSDVRVEPNYFRTVVAPLRNPNVGGVTCLYVSTHDKTVTQHLQSIGMISDFYPGILVARQLDGIKFALGQTIVTTRARIASFGGYEAIENRPADDLLVGRLIAEQGCEVELLPYAAYEAVGALRTGLHTRAAMELGDRCDSSASDWSRLSRHLCSISAHDDMADWLLGIETVRAMEEAAVDLRLGCHRVCHLAFDVWTKEHPMAQRRLPDSRGDARARRSATCSEFLAVLEGQSHSRSRH
jgi:hypothetical protein